MLFSPDQIMPTLKASERFAAIREMVAHLVRVGRIRPEDEGAVVEAAIKREKSMSTGMGFGYASPRARVACVEDIVLAVGVSPSGIEFDALDNLPVTFIAMFIIPANSQAHESKLMGFTLKFPEIFRKSEFRGQLSRSTSAEELWSILKPAFDACLSTGA